MSLALAASSLSTSTLPEVTPAVNAESTSILPRIISPEDVVKLQELNLSSEAVSLLEVPSSTRSPEKDCGISNSILTLLEYKPEKKEDFVFTLMRRVLPVTWASMYGTKEGSFVRTIPVREALTFGESTILRVVSVLDTEISIFLMEPGSNSMMPLTSYTLLIPPNLSLTPPLLVVLVRKDIISTPPVIRIANKVHMIIFLAPIKKSSRLSLLSNRRKTRQHCFPYREWYHNYRLLHGES